MPQVRTSIFPQEGTFPPMEETRLTFQVGIFHSSSSENIRQASLLTHSLGLTHQVLQMSTLGRIMR